jgi:hypothetical protein
MPVNAFHIYKPDEFRDYLNSTQFIRPIRFIQNHHTWEPDYGSFQEKQDELYWLNSMRDYHMKVRGWSNIGQNLTTFPSGNIGLCRPIDTTPAGILGANQGAICIENLGNFDTGHDQMTTLQKNTIIFLNAVLCLKFNLTPVKTQIVYHHWFDHSGQRFPDDKINKNQVGPNEQKTCPGTAFFSTNTIDSAEANFYPGIKDKIAQLGVIPLSPGVLKEVNAIDGLNIRSAPSATASKEKVGLDHGIKVTVYTTFGNWSKISNTSERWVSSYYLIDIP